jgi:3-oxoacyl-(acyl-carrier-protein) synthase
VLDTFNWALDFFDTLPADQTALWLVNGDASEDRAICAVFGTDTRCSSTKGYLGHTLGAAGAMESTAAILALTHGFLPPTINYSEPDPDCDLDCVPCTGRDAPHLEYALSNSFAFGGLNAVIAFRNVK